LQLRFPALKIDAECLNSVFGKSISSTPLNAKPMKSVVTLLMGLMLAGICVAQSLIPNPWTFASCYVWRFAGWLEQLQYLPGLRGKPLHRSRGL
jgi:hypothetical protein